MNRAQRFGDGVFETFRVYQGKALFLELHLERLALGFQTLGFANSVPTQAACQQWVRAAWLKAGQPPHARARLTVFREGEGAYTPETDHTAQHLELVALPGPWQLPASVQVVAYTENGLHPGPLAAIKSLNALPYVLAARYAREQEADEALLFGPTQQLAECSAANLFWVRGHRLFTPGDASGRLPGVMATVVMGVATELGYQVANQAEETLADWVAAPPEAVFCTNVIRGVWPIECVRNAWQRSGAALHPTEAALMAALSARHFKG